MKYVKLCEESKSIVKKCFECGSDKLSVRFHKRHTEIEFTCKKCHLKMAFRAGEDKDEEDC